MYVCVHKHCVPTESDLHFMNSRVDKWFGILKLSSTIICIIIILVLPINRPTSPNRFVRVHQMPSVMLSIEVIEFQMQTKHMGCPYFVSTLKKNPVVLHRYFYFYKFINKRMFYRVSQFTITVKAFDNVSRVYRLLGTFVSGNSAKTELVKNCDTVSEGISRLKHRIGIVIFNRRYNSPTVDQEPNSKS